MNVNISKEKIAAGRTPTNSSYNKGPISDFTQYELKKSTQVNREVLPGFTQGTGLVVPLQTPNSNMKFYFNDRILSHIDENLQGNPYINNIVHKSVN